LDEDEVSFPLVWQFFLQCVNPHHCCLPGKVQRWYHIPVQHCGGVVLGGGSRIRRLWHLMERC